jgi:hypothetical protein
MSILAAGRGAARHGRGVGARGGPPPPPAGGGGGATRVPPPAAARMGGRGRQPLTGQFEARKSIAKAGAAFQFISARMPVKTAFWCST